MKRCLIIPDTHIPFHDTKAYALMLKVAQDYKPHEIVILGDFADFYSVSSHSKDPSVLSLLVDEVESVNSALDELDMLFPRAKKVFIEGNHEYRLERYLVDKAPALFGVTDLNYLFNLHGRPNWSLIPYGPSQSYSVGGGKLTARHEPPKGSILNIAKEAGCSIVFGHVHRKLEAHHVSLEGVNRIAICPGWLGDKRQKKIFGYVKNHHQWQLGFMLVDVEESGWFHINPIHILDNMTCLYNGKLYKG